MSSNSINTINGRAEESLPEEGPGKQEDATMAPHASTSAEEGVGGKAATDSPSQISKKAPAIYIPSELSAPDYTNFYHSGFTRHATKRMSPEDRNMVENFIRHAKYHSFIYSKCFFEVNSGKRLIFCPAYKFGKDRKPLVFVVHEDDPRSWTIITVYFHDPHHKKTPRCFRAGGEYAKHIPVSEEGWETLAKSSMLYNFESKKRFFQTFSFMDNRHGNSRIVDYNLSALEQKEDGEQKQYADKVLVKQQHFATKERLDEKSLDVDERKKVENHQALCQAQCKYEQERNNLRNRPYEGMEEHHYEKSSDKNRSFSVGEIKLAGSSAKNPELQPKGEGSVSRKEKRKGAAQAQVVKDQDTFHANCNEIQAWYDYPNQSSHTSQNKIHQNVPNKVELSSEEFAVHKAKIDAATENFLSDTVVESPCVVSLAELAERAIDKQAYEDKLMWRKKIDKELENIFDPDVVYTKDQLERLKETQEIQDFKKKLRIDVDKKVFVGVKKRFESLKIDSD